MDKCFCECSFRRRCGSTVLLPYYVFWARCDVSDEEDAPGSIFDSALALEVEISAQQAEALRTIIAWCLSRIGMPLCPSCILTGDEVVFWEKAEKRLFGIEQLDIS
jgi:hypothetical protein